VRIELAHYLVLSGVLFSIGAAGFLVRRNALVALMSIELMLNAVNLTLIAFNRWQPIVDMPVRQAANAATVAGAAAANGGADAAANAANTAAQTIPMIPHHGQVFAFFVIAVAAAEAAVGLAIVLSLYRVRKVVRTDDANLLKE
jgi:NADH-quinone oxidoreductase subunit K